MRSNYLELSVPSHHSRGNRGRRAKAFRAGGGDRPYRLEPLEVRQLLAAAAGGVVANYLPPQHDLLVRTGTLTQPAAGKPLDLALAYLKANAGRLGLAPADVANPIVTSQYTDPDTGVTHIYLRQRYNGLEVANADLALNVLRDGRILNVAGGFVPNIGGAPGAGITPAFSAVTAVDRTAIRLGLKNTHVPAVVGTTTRKDRKATLRQPELSLDDIPARLHYVAASDGTVHLAWNVVIRTHDARHWYSTSIADGDGSVLYKDDWVDNDAAPTAPAPANPAGSSAGSANAPAAQAVAATYNVYARPTESPNDGVRSIVTSPEDLAVSPFGWHDTDGVAGPEYTDTRGNNVFAQEDANADNAGGFRPDGSAGLSFNFTFDPALAPASNQSATITNLFYWNNLLHDIHARYGFTEAAGNFQVKNYSGAGVGNDQVMADDQDGSGTNNANFATPPDGSSGRMQMYNWNYASPARDSSMDATVMVHEYGHGVSNRLTGGPANASALNATQSGGMGEGWGDWWALMLTQKSTDTKAMAYPVATYSYNNTTAGLRRKPYGFDMTIDPLTIDAYGTSGTTSYGIARSTEVHDSGELWCTTLWDMNWLLIDKYGFNPNVQNGYDPAQPAGGGGNILALKLVMDALKLQPANPSFKDARDAILQADQVLTGGANAREIWTAFARRGMGNSFATASSSSTIVTPAFDLPLSVLEPSVSTSSPALVTGPTGPVSLSFTFSKAMDTTSFDAAADVNSFTGPGGANLLSQITGYTWSGDARTLTVNFTAQTTDGVYSMNIGPQILAGDDKHPMNQDGDATSGEAVQDAYTATFRYDAVPMTVVSTTPANGSNVTLPLTTIDVKFSEPVAASSVVTSDLVLSQGAVTAATPIAADTARFTVSGLTTEGTLTLSIAAGAVTDASGGPMAAYSGSYALDLGTVPFPTPLVAKNPPGSLIYDPVATGTIGASDGDSFTLDLDAGETISVYARATGSPATLKAALELRDPSATLLGSATAPAAGKDAVLQTITATAAGTYTITVSGDAGSTGGYSVAVVLNAALEAESHDGATNDSLATAQNIDASFAPIGTAGATRGAVLGTGGTGTGSTNTTFDFGNGLQGFTIDNSLASGLWHLSVGHGAETGHTATQSVYFGTGETATGGGTYNTGARTSGALISPSITIAPSSTIGFNYILKTEGSSSWDDAWLQISTNNGTSWTTLATYNGVAESATWRAATPVSLASYAGQTAKFRFFFDTIDSGANAYEGWYVDDVSVKSVTSGNDYYAMTLGAGDSATIGLSALPPGGSVHVTMLDSAGNTLTGGVGGAGNVNELIRDFVAPTGGTYYLLVNAPSGVDYTLLATRNAGFDTEPNETYSAAQPVQSAALGATGERTILGNVGPTGADVFAITGAAGDVLDLTTFTPGDGAGQPVNALNPRVRLLSSTGTQLALDDNSAADARNAHLVYTATAAGTYYVEVSPSTATTPATSGDYVLSIKGGGNLAAPFTVTSTSPASGLKARTAPASITVNFSDAILLTSLQASDFTVDGAAATAFTLGAAGANAVTFTLPAGIGDGAHTFAIAAGAISDVQATPLTAFSGTFSVDNTPPRVVNSSLQNGQTVAAGALTYTVTFTEPMRATTAFAYQLQGLGQGATIGASTAVWSAGNTVLTLTYQNLIEDQYRITLFAQDNAFEDVAGNNLDGETPNWPIPPNQSGDGVEGGNFVLNFAADVVTAALPTPLVAKAPLGSWVYEGTTSNYSISTATDTDSFTIALDAGQTVTVVVDPAATLQPTVELRSPANVSLATTASAGAGKDAVLQTITAATPGTYIVVVSGAAGTTGGYSLTLDTNAAQETESHDGGGDDTLATAQDLSAGFLSVGSFASRAAVVGIAAAAPGDLYSFTMSAGDTVSIAMSASSTAQVALLDPTGAVVVTGSTSATNMTQGIADYTADATGTYYVRVTGTAGATYTAVVTRNAAFDAEPNDSYVTGQTILSQQTDGEQLIEGYVGGTEVADVYAIYATAGSVLMASTTTPGDVTGEFVNALDPRLRILSSTGAQLALDENSGGDGRNAFASYTVPSTGAGAYYVEVAPGTGSTTRGEYVLSIKDQSVLLPSFNVSGTTPGNGARIKGPLTTMTVVFNDTILQSSLQAADFVLDGAGVSAINLVDPKTVSLTLPAGLTDGVHRLTIAAGAVKDIQNTPIQAFSGQFTLDSAPPRVVSSSVQEGGAVPTGTLTYAAKFNESMLATNIDATDFSLVGAATGARTGTFVYAAGTNTLTLTFTGLAEDLYTLTLLSADGRFEDLAGNNLDGETPTWPIPPNQSGDGVEGGNFVVHFSVDFPTRALPTPFTSRGFNGSAVFDSSATGLIGNAVDDDVLTMSLDAGQTVTLVADPAAGLRPKIELLDAGGGVLGSASSAAAGKDALLQTQAVTTAGTYQLRISSLGGTSGTYAVRAILNAAEEPENHDGAGNDTLAAAQDLDGAFATLGSGASLTRRAAVLGSLSSTPASDDWYSFSLAAGDVTTVGLKKTDATATVGLYDASGTLLAISASGGGYDQIISNFVAPAAGRYFVKVNGTTSSYTLLVAGNAALDQEPNDSLAQAQPLGPATSDFGELSRAAIGYIDRGTLGVEPDNYAAGTVLTSVVPGISLSAQGDTLSITSQTSSYVSTGTRAFAHGTILDWYSSAYWLRADIAGGASSVSIDLVPNDTFDPGIMRAFNSAGVLLQELQVPAPTLGSFATMTITRPTADIAYILAAGLDGDTAQLDHLVVGGGASAAGDYYSVSVNAGDTLAIGTTTPGGGGGDFVNTLDPKVELYEPSGTLVGADDNSAADGRNASLSYAATAAGTYMVRVIGAASSAGEYVLNVAGATGVAPPLTVTATTPANNAVVSQVSQITIDFSNPLLLASVQASDLTVDGVAAQSVSVISPTRLTFTVPTVSADGPHTFALAAGTITDVRGQPLASFTGTFVVDGAPPHVVNTSIQEGASLSSTTPLVYTVTFSKPMLVANLDAADFSLIGAGGSTAITPTSFSFNTGAGAGTVLTLNYPALPENAYTLTLLSADGRFEDTTGNNLDGETPAWPIPPNQSGDGVEGGNFVVHFSTDPGTLTMPAFVAKGPSGSLVYESTSTGTISSAGDVDDFTVTIDAGQTVSAMINAAGSSLSPRVTIFGPGGQNLGTGYGSSVKVASVIPVENGAGTYTIRVSNDGGTSTGAYTISVLLNAIYDDDITGSFTADPHVGSQNIDSSTVVLIPADSTIRRHAVAGTLSGNFDADWYGFAAFGPITVALARGAGSSGSVTMSLYDSTFSSVLATATTSAGAGNYDAVLSWPNVTPNARYYVDVTGAAGSSYTLVTTTKATLDLGNNNTLATAQDVTRRGYVLGSLQTAAASSDYFSFDMLAGETMHLQTRTPADGPYDVSNLLNPAIEIYRPDGTLLAGNTDGAPDGRNALLDVVAPIAGEYVVRVLATSGTGEYVLTATQNRPPVASPDAVTMNEDAPGTAFSVVSNDTDPDGNPLSIIGTTNPAHGSIVVNPNRTIRYTPDGDYFGSDSYTYTISDGALTSTATVSLTINPVNDAPRFTAGGDQTVAADAGAVDGWATAISAGPANESTQAMTFVVTTDNDALFSVLPAIDPATGKLTFTPAANASGVANVTVQLKDDGGAANGGIDTSAPQAFKITITSVIDNTPPSVLAGDFAYDAPLVSPPTPAQHFLSITFSEGVQNSLTLDDLSIANLTSGQTLPASSLQLSYEPGNVARVWFSGFPQGLPKGNYRLTLNAAGVTDAAGNAMTGDWTYDFFIVPGDANHDRNVDLTDFTILAANFNGTGKTFSQGDFNYDGTVDLTDFTILAGTFNTTLPITSPPAAAHALALGGGSGGGGGSTLVQDMLP